jgi:hypothetical protein
VARDDVPEFCRVDVEAAPDDEVAGAVQQLEVAVLVDPSEVIGVDPVGDADEVGRPGASTIVAV